MADFEEVKKELDFRKEVKAVLLAWLKSGRSWTFNGISEVDTYVWKSEEIADVLSLRVGNCVQERLSTKPDMEEPTTKELLEELEKRAKTALTWGGTADDRNSAETVLTLSRYAMHSMTESILTWRPTKET